MNWINVKMTTRALPLFLLALAPVLKGQGEVQLPAPSNAIVDAARAQIGVTVAYDPAYVPLDYPGGDVPRDRGVCTDVVIRALRRGKGMDLSLIHI